MKTDDIKNFYSEGNVLIFRTIHPTLSPGTVRIFNLFSINYPGYGKVAKQTRAAFGLSCKTGYQ